MPRGISTLRRSILRRGQGSRVLELFHVGPFIELEIDGVIAGSVRRKRGALPPRDCEIEECLVFSHYVVLLNAEEVALINAALSRD